MLTGDCWRWGLILFYLSSACFVLADRSIVNSCREDRCRGQHPTDRVWDRRAFINLSSPPNPWQRHSGQLKEVMWKRGRQCPQNVVTGSVQLARSAQPLLRSLSNSGSQDRRLWGMTCVSSLKALQDFCDLSLLTFINGWPCVFFVAGRGRSRDNGIIRPGMTPHLTISRLTSKLCKLAVIGNNPPREN